MDFLVWYATPYCFCHNKNTAVINNMEHFLYFFCSIIFISASLQAVHMLFKRTQRLHKRTLKISADAHNLACCFHLCSKCPFSLYKFIKWKAWYLYHNIVKCRLKAGICLACNSIWYLIKCIPKRNLCRHLCNRIACCL